MSVCLCVIVCQYALCIKEELKLFYSRNQGLTLPLFIKWMILREEVQCWVCVTLDKIFNVTIVIYVVVIFHTQKQRYIVVCSFCRQWCVIRKVSLIVKLWLVIYLSLPYSFAGVGLGGLCRSVSGSPRVDPVRSVTKTPGGSSGQNHTLGSGTHGKFHRAQGQM